MEVDVIRSPKRRKTVQARVVDGRIKVSIPATMSPDDERHWVDVMRRRIERTHSSAHIDLDARTRRLAAKHHLPLPTSIVWSDRQTTLWGSCSVETQRIRISRRVAGFPPWVLDYVIVHELAHLIEPRHDAAFRALVDCYPMAERARGYLIAKGVDAT